MLSANDIGHSPNLDDTFVRFRICSTVARIGAINCFKCSATAHATYVYPALNLSMVLRGELLWKCTDCSSIMETTSSDNDCLSNVESSLGNIQTDLLETKQLMNQRIKRSTRASLLKTSVF